MIHDRRAHAEAIETRVLREGLVVSIRSVLKPKWGFFAIE